MLRETYYIVKYLNGMSDGVTLKTLFNIGVSFLAIIVVFKEKPLQELVAILYLPRASRAT